MLVSNTSMAKGSRPKEPGEPCRSGRTCGQKAPWTHHAGEDVSTSWTSRCTSSCRTRSPGSPAWRRLRSSPSAYAFHRRSSSPASPAAFFVVFPFPFVFAFPFPLAVVAAPPFFGDFAITSKGSSSLSSALRFFDPSPASCPHACRTY